MAPIRSSLALCILPLAVASMSPSLRPGRAEDSLEKTLSVGRIDVVAGSEKAGYSGDGGPAKAALFAKPFHCDLDGAGNLYIADTMNGRVRKIDLKSGIITTVAGTGEQGSGGDGGPATKAALQSPYSVAVHRGSGDIYIVEPPTAVVRKIDGKTGIITTVAGNGRKGFGGDGGKATDAMFREPNDCCLDGRGGLLIADVADWRVRRLDLKTGIIATFAGIGKPGQSGKGVKMAKKADRSKIGDGGMATNAIVAGARGVCVDGKGNTYICEREGNAIRKVDDKGIITTVAGTGDQGHSGDGANAAAATFKGPKGVRCDYQGNIYVVDSDNHAIRKIDVATNVVTTVAGGRQGTVGNGGDAVKAGLDKPHGCVLDRDGTLYIADSWNNRICRVSFTK